MGFREISKFNDFLLAKQVWRLIHHEDSLFSRFFKAKFFSNHSLLDVPFSNKGSYAWKRIFQARKVIELGTDWRLSYGKSIRVRGDKWFLCNPSNQVISPLVTLPFEARVCDLINEELHC